MEIKAAINAKLIDNQWFVATDWGLPDLHFKEYAWDSEIDHFWHEFEGIEETLGEVTELNCIEDFIFLLGKTKLPW